MRLTGYGAAGQRVAREVALLRLGTVTQGIDPHAALRHLKVEVRAGGVSGGAGDADDIALVHILAAGHLAAAEMGIEGGIAAAVGKAIKFLRGDLHRGEQ